MAHSTPAETIESIANEVRDVPGAFIELGVFKGNTFVSIVKEAVRLSRVAYGFDSFTGMNTPTEQDNGHYPKGSMNSGGTGAVMSRLAEAGLGGPNYRLVKGYVPDSLHTVTIDSIAFAHVDLDQYLPTKEALKWVWERLSNRGVILCHDYFKGRRSLATLAVDEFIVGKRSLCKTHVENYTMRITRTCND